MFFNFFFCFFVKGLITIAKAKYVEWLTADGLLLLGGWARDGLSDEQIANNMGINVGTLYRWQNEHNEIREALKKGKAPVDMEVENALLKRALGYDWTEVTEEVYGDGKKHVKRVKRHVPADVAAMCFWLKNRKGKYWRDRPEFKEDSDALKAAKKLLEGIESAID